MKLFQIIPLEIQDRVACANLATLRNRKGFAVFLTKILAAASIVDTWLQTVKAKKIIMQQNCTLNSEEQGLQLGDATSYRGFPVELPYSQLQSICSWFFRASKILDSSVEIQKRQVIS